MQPVTLSDNDYRALDSWHLNLSIIQEAFDSVFSEFAESSDKESYVSIFKVLNESLFRSIDSFPGAPVQFDNSINEQNPN